MRNLTLCTCAQTPQTVTHILQQLLNYESLRYTYCLVKLSKKLSFTAVYRNYKKIKQSNLFKRQKTLKKKNTNNKNKKKD